MLAQAFELTGLYRMTAYQSLIREVRGCARSLGLTSLALDFPANRENNREKWRISAACPNYSPFFTVETVS